VVTDVTLNIYVTPDGRRWNDINWNVIILKDLTGDVAK